MSSRYLLNWAASSLLVFAIWESYWLFSMLWTFFKFLAIQLRILSVFNSALTSFLVIYSNSFNSSCKLTSSLLTNIYCCFSSFNDFLYFSNPYFSCLSYVILFSLSAILLNNSPYTCSLFKNLKISYWASLTPVAILMFLKANSTVENFYISLYILFLNMQSTSLLTCKIFSQFFSFSSLSCIAFKAISSI